MLLKISSYIQLDFLAHEIYPLIFPNISKSSKSNNKGNKSQPPHRKRKIHDFKIPVKPIGEHKSVYLPSILDFMSMVSYYFPKYLKALKAVIKKM